MGKERIRISKMMSEIPATMGLTDYQGLAHTTSLNSSINGDKIAYAALALCGEAGEVAEKIKKIHRDKNGIIDGDDADEVIKEMGDVLWYLAEISTHLCTTLDLVARRNLEKLFDRKNRKKLHGNGDNR